MKVFSTTSTFRRNSTCAAFLPALLMALMCQVSFAQVPPPPPPLKPAPTILQRIGITQNLGAQVPLDLAFKDEAGRDVHLGDYFKDRPVILTLVYYRCPSLCTMVLNDMVRSIRTMDLTAGKDFQIVTVSFDPNETPDLAAAKKKQYMASYHHPGAENGWHFLTGKQPEISRLTESVGFHYAWDEGSKTYAHASGIMILTPSGKISRYFYGIDYAPSDLKLSLIAASSRKIGSPTEKILLYCFCYDPKTGRYGLMVWRMVQVGCAITILALGGFIGLSLWREHHPVSRRRVEV